MKRPEADTDMLGGEARFVRRLRGWKRWALTLAGTSTVAVLGVFDLKSGIEVPLSMFYLLPVMAASWYCGQRAGLLVAFLSAISYYLTHHPHWGSSRTLVLLTADSAARLIFYSALSFIAANIRLYLERQYNLARTDPLTGAANPRRFYEQAGLEVARARRYRRPLTLVYFDIDGFKEINDTYGHQMGDLLLMEISGAVSRAIRGTDLLARMGGDEFAILMPETSSEQAERAVEKLLNRAIKMGVRNNPLVTLSFGVATFYSTTDSVANMVCLADRLMYKAKEQGKNRVVAEKIS